MQQSGVIFFSLTCHSLAGVILFLLIGLERFNQLPALGDLNYKERLESFSPERGRLSGDLMEIYKIRIGKDKWSVFNPR